MNTGNQILREMEDLLNILESWNTSEPLLDDAEYLKDAIITRLIHIQGHVDKLRRIGNI